jgi:hypothetical protein
MKYFITEPKYLVNEWLTNISDELKDKYKELKSKGFLIIDQFLNIDECKGLQSEMDIHINKDYAWTDELGSDKRVYGIEHVSEPFNGLFNKPQLNSIFNKYIDNKSREEFIMANKIQFMENNLGSGGGWHRDSINRRQLKFIVYLTDVTESTGCFQYIEHSHTIWQKYKINKLLNKPFGAYRYSEEDVSKLLDYGYKLRNIPGAAGTILIVDTGGIHRGKPLGEGGKRYAATSYLSETKFGSHIVKELVKNKI